MDTGLLWFDNDPQRGLTAKIQDAARHYQEKFGVAPDTCYVNQRTLDQGASAVTLADAALRVVPSSAVLVNHFWVGVEETQVRALAGAKAPDPKTKV